MIPGLQSLGLLSGQINFCGNPLCLRYHLGNVGLMESLYNKLCSAAAGGGERLLEGRNNKNKAPALGGSLGALDNFFFFNYIN